MTEYEKFKKLLEYFMAHLEFCVTDQKVGDGYDRYIKVIKNFNRSGQGHKGQNIQNQIKEWESYTNGDICININPTVYKGRGCYLNWEETSINVNALWNNDSIVGLKIVKDSYPISNAKDVVSYSVQDLGLLDNNPPNENLKSFFDRFDEIIIQWNKEQESKQEMKQIQPYIDLLKSSKNIILTGAPGTGKTFLAKQIAKQMIGVKTDDELEESGQFNFVQFHPSYDYTDFVEGLRPTPPDENGIIGFEIKDGIFKSFCQKASEAKFSEIVDNFDLAWENLLTAIRNSIAQGTLTTIGSWDYGLSSKDSLKYSSLNTPSQYNFTITKKNVYDAYQGKQSRPSGAFQKDMEDVVNYLKANFDLVEFTNNQESTNNGIKNYVFVIDEINRGEISKIFGELFFSIDPSYRGKKGAVKTQYSNLHSDEKEVFYVPENVYIIGSMNDIDRSVESFDFAMRRRFTWIEITAVQSADNMNLPQNTKERMLKLNEQISNTDGLNPSYHIGAAYFLDSNGNARQDIDNIWSLRIEPLLKEYLRGMPDSFEKIELLKNAFTV
ncbi:McrB family protein [Flavobacterium franklandianum]|uniref:AAA family ATPase n=1 Tax=Flavobacterium franklandianum TaxID=2594430 RepID=A0A553C635_9FLAO|nr:AAA family ATPase [Flavobacterium franklandianum]TRX15997.1 AAA family ATPase [Flavobacterium franklandianum]